MAKSKSRPKTRTKPAPPRAAARPPKRAATVRPGKGELETGGARHRDAAPSVPTPRREIPRNAARQSEIQVHGEKAVAHTDETFPVAEHNVPAEREPIPPRAVDTRRQVAGADDTAGATPRAAPARRGGRRRN